EAGRLLGGEPLQLGGHVVRDLGPDGPGAARGAPDQDEARPRRRLGLARRHDAPASVEDEAGAELELGGQCTRFAPSLYQRNSTSSAPTTDMTKPAGWKRLPSTGLRTSRVRKPPTKEPTIPSAPVRRRPMCCAPGMSARARSPTTIPMRNIQR